MKQIFLILAILLPLCVFSQKNKTVLQPATRSGDDLIMDSFDGPLVTSANPWSGDLDCFRVTDAGELQLAGDQTKKKARLWLPLVFAPTMQWEFELRMNLNPTNSNHVKVYLYSTLSPVTGKVEEYYVQVGSNNRDVTLRRLKETAKTPTVLIVGEKNLLDKETVSLKIKLTLEKESEWRLYTCMAGETGYRLQGSYRKALADLRESGYFRLECIYSNTHAEDFFFDTIRIGSQMTATPMEPGGGGTSSENPSTLKPPALVNFSEESGTEVFLYFDRAADVESASFVLDECGEAEEVSISEDETVVWVRWRKERRKGITYTLVYSGVWDKEKQKAGGGSYTFTSQRGVSSDNSSEEGTGPNPGEPENPPSFAAGSVLINEIMADPKGLLSLPQTEYVEVYNASGSAVQLKDWSFLYGEKPTVLESCLLPAGGYGVLYRKGRDIQVKGAGQALPLAAFPSALANAGKRLQLKDPAGHLVDEVTYGKAKPAVSWERSVAGWHLSTDPEGGTPGMGNSAPDSGKEPSEDGPGSNPPKAPEVPDTPPGSDPSDTPQPPAPPETLLPEPGEIVFNELLPDPFPEGSEYVELYNRSDRELSLIGLAVAVRKADGSLSTRYPLSSVASTLESGGYALLTKDKEGVESFYLIASPSALHQLKLPVLANTSSTLVLFRTTDATVIDEIAYASKWHASSVKNQKGVALERIDPDRPTQDRTNWTSATESAGYGTPGYRNSQYKWSGPGHVTGIEAPVFSEMTGSYSIAYFLDQSGYHCRARIYDTAGRLRAEIANHTLLGMEGEIPWKGDGADGRPLRSGLYIFYGELYHESGETHAFKKVFLVR